MNKSRHSRFTSSVALVLLLMQFSVELLHAQCLTCDVMVRFTVNFELNRITRWGDPPPECGLPLLDTNLECKSNGNTVVVNGTVWEGTDPEVCLIYVGPASKTVTPCYTTEEPCPVTRG